MDGLGYEINSPEVSDGLRTSSTTKRIRTLHDITYQVKDRNGTGKLKYQEILQALFLTYPTYHDRGSRQAVQACLDVILPLSYESFRTFTQFLITEASKEGLAPSNGFVLLEWDSLALQLCATDSRAWRKCGIDLVTAGSQLIELCMASAGKKSQQHSAIIVTRRALRKLYKTSHGEDTIKATVEHLSAKGQPLGKKNAVMLGIVAGVCSRLPEKRASLENTKDQYVAFWIREIVGSKVTVPNHISSALQDFFSEFVTLQDLDGEIVPALEKGLLRAPEIVLNDLIRPMILALPVDIDLADALANHLLRPLLSNLKSTNPSIRDGAVSTFQILAERSHDIGRLKKVFNDVLTPLKTSKVQSAEQRTLHARMLSMLPVENGECYLICDELAKIAMKEPNEVAIAAEAAAINHHFIEVIKSDSTNVDNVISAFTKGLEDRRPAFQKIWALRAGEIISRILHESIRNELVTHFVELVFAKLLSIYNEVIANSMHAVQSGIIVAAYITVALHPFIEPLIGKCQLSTAIQKAKITYHALAYESKPSFLLNQKIYTKIIGEEDSLWAIKAFGACVVHIQGLEQESASCNAWSQGALYFLSGSNIPFATHDAAVAMLRESYLNFPRRISNIVVNGLWTWRANYEFEDRDTAAMIALTGIEHLHLAVRAITPKFDKSREEAAYLEPESLQDQLIEMLVLCRPEVLPRTDWIETCIRVGQDPGALVRDRAERCVKQLNDIWTVNLSGAKSATIEVATYNTAAELAFVAPDTVIPLLLQQMEKELNADSLRAFNLTDFAIARTPDGVAFVDVLSTGAQSQLLEKGSRDYDTLKWEDDIRNQLAQKRGQQKKLTTEEQNRVNAQLKKEATIRTKVNQLESHLRRGIGIIQALATGPPIDADMWMGYCLNALLAIIHAGAGTLVGSSANHAYLECANYVSSRLGTLRYFIGVATLRALHAPRLSPNLMQEPLGDLVTRVLYRLRITSEQRSYDSVSLSYMLPLVSIVLQQHGIGHLGNEEADEQVTLALEFLSLHANSFAHRSLPREKILSILIFSMQEYSQHYRVIKDCIQDICRSISANTATAEAKALLAGAINPQATVRLAVLQAIRDEIDLTDLDFCEEIWLAAHDENEDTAELGQAVWRENALGFEPSDAIKIVPYLGSSDRQLRRAASRALAECIAGDGEAIREMMKRLELSYREKAKPPAQERDQYGMPRKTDRNDDWEIRSGIALAFKEMAPHFANQQVVPFIEFMVNDGAVGDRHPSVRDEMIESATTVIATHGGHKVEELMTMFENALNTSESASEVSDLVSEAVVILYGALAVHLQYDDNRVPQVVNRLLATLSTPSETVQYAVASCLPPLIRTSSQNVPDYVRRVLDQLLQSKKYAARRGAAYGLAGIVSGRGILAFREFRIMSTLRTAIEDKKDANHRQGALLAYELLSLILGRIFEPYIIRIVPQLLASFSDANADVRDACLDAAKACFASLSSFGVRIILPTLLQGLDEDQWRSKKGACDLLGAMAYLDPQQLAQSLPEIIPSLTNVLNDSHKEVRASANRSLQRFGEVISNPEVKGLIDILLKALSDPTKYTDLALDSLIKVSFIHYLDAPSLALVVRILERGLEGRSATKRKSAQIIGSLAHLTERKDLMSHLPILVAGLRLAAVDPVPTTRATSSKALGSLIEKLGEEALPDLIPGLMSTLKSETGAGDRLGSAQALSEVLAGLGTSRLEETLPTILQNVASTKPSVREGFMSLFIFLPACFGNSFSNYLSRIIPPILLGLADEIESIRETSLRAGRLLVKNFATKAIDLLLPELDRGLGDDNYRIRLSSVELVGDLLFNLTGISGSTEEDEVNEGAVEAGQSLLEVLGEDKRNRILSSLYICRCDTSGLVRSASITVWKALVASPRTLKELVPTLTQAIIRRLASSNMEQKVIASNALGELIRKAGEGVLASLLPTLEEALQTSTDIDNRQGICIALREVISSASPEVLEDYEKTLISIVRTALVDSNDDVREAAAEAFDSLQQIFGKKAVDQVLPYLLNLLRTESEANTALSAVLTLLTDHTRSNIILPNLVPTLLTPPVTAFNAKAIASLSEVAGSAMARRLPVILNTLMDNLVQSKDESFQVEIGKSFDSILSTVDENDGLNTAMSVMLTMVKHDDHRRRALADTHMGTFFANANVDFARFNQDLIRVLLISFDDRDADVVKAAWVALSELTKRLKKEEMESLVAPTRQIIQQVGYPGTNLPGFSLPKGIGAILPIFLQGLLNGTAEQRTQSALAISDIIDRTDPDALKPFVTQVTGPLIRVVSERSVDVRCRLSPAYPLTSRSND